MNDWMLILLLAVWVFAGIVLLVVRLRRGTEGTGLIYAYLLHMWTIHWLAAAIYLAPWYPTGDPAPMAAGFVQATYGMLGLVFGTLVLWPLVRDLRVHVPVDPEPLLSPEHSLPKLYLVVGAVCYILLTTGIGRLPTMTSVVSAGQQLVVVGLCLIAWRAWQEGGTGRLLSGLAVTATLPIVTILVQGFLSYGAVSALAVFLFVASFYRPRWRLAVWALVVAYLALSFYVSYMRDRDEIRSAVWAGRPFEDRIAQLSETLTTLDLFNPMDVAHLYAIDVRLNQNLLVGLAVERMKWTGDFTYGDVFVQMLAALVPRTLWPDKPYAAGSGDLVSQYTGLRFAEGTSVGIGQVMELFVGFGVPGVVIGFMVMGVLVSWVDEAAARHLQAGHWRRYAISALVGLSLLQVGGSLFEVVTSAGASVVAALLANRLYDALRRRELLDRVVVGLASRVAGTGR